MSSEHIEMSNLFLWFFFFSSLNSRSSGDITKASRLARLSRSTGKSTSSTLSECSVKRPMVPRCTSASTLARYGDALSWVTSRNCTCMLSILHPEYLGVRVKWNIPYSCELDIQNTMYEQCHILHTCLSPGPVWGSKYSGTWHTGYLHVNTMGRDEYTSM